MNKKNAFFLLLAIIALAACTQPKRPVAKLHTEPSDTVTIADSTTYGIIGEETAMHTLQVITNDGDTVQYMLNDEDVEPSSNVMGGLLVGDRVAVCAVEANGETIATKVINLTTLLGHWTSVARNFTLEEDGSVKSDINTESHPWTAWKIVNGQLLLNKDTFDIEQLGADSLAIENADGIFVYKRM